MFWLIRGVKASNAATGTTIDLHIEPVYVVDMCVAGFVPDPLQEGGTGGGTVYTNTYTGPAYLLSAPGLSSNLVIECSTDLEHWRGFPEEGFQLTLTATNPSSVVITPPGPQMFFRGR